VFSDLDDEELEIAHIAALAAEVSTRVERDGEHIAGLGPGDVVGEMAVLERSQRTATVTATSPMVPVTLTGWDIRRLRKTAPDAVDHLRGVVAQGREHA
jgi:CRP/FNR family transcriptional regulator, cyclic AMP receptor protein